MLYYTTFASTLGSIWLFSIPSEVKVKVRGYWILVPTIYSLTILKRVCGFGCCGILCLVYQKLTFNPSPKSHPLWSSIQQNHRMSILELAQHNHNSYPHACYYRTIDLVPIDLLIWAASSSPLLSRNLVVAPSIDWLGGSPRQSFYFGLRFHHQRKSSQHQTFANRRTTRPVI